MSPAMMPATRMKSSEFASPPVFPVWNDTSAKISDIGFIVRTVAHIQTFSHPGFYTPPESAPVSFLWRPAELMAQVESSYPVREQSNHSPEVQEIIHKCSLFAAL